MLRISNGLISWQGQTQNVVTLSTQKSEFYPTALSALEEIGTETVSPRIIQEDNMACIWHPQHPGSYVETKYSRSKL